MIGVAHRSGDKSKLAALNALMPGQSKCPGPKSRSHQTLENKRQLCSGCRHSIRQGRASVSGRSATLTTVCYVPMGRYCGKAPLSCQQCANRTRTMPSPCAAYLFGRGWCIANQFKGWVGDSQRYGRANEINGLRRSRRFRLSVAGIVLSV